MDDKELRLACAQAAMRIHDIRPHDVVAKATEIYNFCTQNQTPSIVLRMEDDSCSTQRPADGV